MKKNQTIAALKIKGLSPEFAFCFDLHWRAGLPGRQNRGCPAAKWPPAALSLHDNLTFDLLSLLPFHLLLVAGSCPKQFHRKLTRGCTLLQLSIAPSVEIDMIIQVRSGGLCRIATYIPHPAHVFYNPTTSLDSCAILDTVIGFYLWLLNKNHHTDVFAKLSKDVPTGIPCGAPFHRLAALRAGEKSLRRNLQEHEYETAFWLWAGQFLGGDSADVLSRGESLVEVVNDKLNYLRHKGYVSPFSFVR
jgi:hypothetical protein